MVTPPSNKHVQLYETNITVIIYNSSTRLMRIKFNFNNYFIWAYSYNSLFCHYQGGTSVPNKSPVDLVLSLIRLPLSLDSIYAISVIDWNLYE